MNTIPGDPQSVLERLPGGYHQYILDEPVHLTFVSRSFCDMAGRPQEDLLSPEADGFLQCVCPQDLPIYQEHLRALRAEGGSHTARYRIARPDGSLMHVQDTASCTRLADGRLTADSCLSDITDVMREYENLHDLNSSIPCGYIRYTCDQAPRITYISDQMLRIMRIPQVKDGEFDYLEMYRNNIYLFVPMEDRKRFAGFLDHVRTDGAPISGEMTLMRCDGTRARVYGWVAKSVGEDGTEEFQSVCMDITESNRTERLSESQRYIRALTKIYDKIFEYDFSAGTVKCLYGQNSGVFKWLQNIPMHMHEAMDKWIQTSVFPADQPSVRAFFEAYLRREAIEADGQPPKIRYRAISSSGKIKRYSGIFLKIDRHVSYFCCRNDSDEIEAHDLRSENDSLRSMNENMQELVMRFTDGIVAFEIENDRVKPLYASDNVCGFFGYTKEEWIRMAQSSHSIREFVSKSDVHYEEFMTLLESGEAEFEYLDLETGQPKRIRAVCSHMFSGDPARQYVMLYNVTGREEPEQTGARVYIRTFGYFDVFVDDKPIAFRNEKSKELFALLVDRRGGYISSEEAIGYLWEDEPVNAVTLARYRKVALRLKNILEEYGISEIVESVNGRRRLVLEKVQCDLTEYLSGKDEHAQLFKGSYLTNYSWAETTLGELLGAHA